MSIPDFRSPSIPARDIGSTVFYATVERLTRLSAGCQTSCPAANPLPRGSVPGVLTRPQHSARKKRSPIATRAVPTVRNGFTPTITPQKIQAPSMIRRAAWRAVGLTELPAAQRKRAVCRVARRPFEAARRPRPGKWSPPRGEPRRTGRRPLDAARRLRRPAAGRGPSRRAPAPRSAPPRPLHPWRGPGSARPRPRTAPAGSGSAGDAFVARLARAGRRGRHPRRRRRRRVPGPLPNAAPAPAAARAPDIAHIVKMRGARSARAAAFLQRKDLAPEPGVLTIDRTRYIHEWGRRWSATALKGE